MVSLLYPCRLTSSTQPKRKAEETTLKQFQELIVIQQPTDQLKQQLEEEATQRLQMCQRHGLTLQKMEKIDRRNAETSGGREEGLDKYC